MAQQPDPIETLPRHQRVATSLKTRDAASWSELTCHTFDSQEDRPWISWNSPYEKLIRFLIVDVDHDDDAIPGGMPLPMCTIYSPSGRNHHIWILAKPVTTGPNALVGPQVLLKATQSAVTEALGGDPAFNGTLAKNAWSPRWTTVWHGTSPVDLGVFRAWLPEEQEPVWHKGRRHEMHDDHPGRNCQVFNQTRIWCYDMGVTDGDLIMAKALELNAELQAPMGSKEVLGIARSITKFMNTVWRGRTRPVGPLAAQFTPNMGQRERQSAGAAYTAHTKSEQTARKIDTAFRLAHLMECKWPTISRVARVHGLARNTVKRHLKNLDLPDYGMVN